MTHLNAFSSDMGNGFTATDTPDVRQKLRNPWNRCLWKLCGVFTSITVSIVLVATTPSIFKIYHAPMVIHTLSTNTVPRLVTTISSDEVTMVDAADSLQEVQNMLRNWEGRVFALGDLHGDLHNTMALLVSANIISQSGNWIAGAALLIQTGDIVDRGPHSKPLYSLFQHLGQQALEAGGRIVHLLGNHESLIVCGMYNYLHPFELHQYYRGSYEVLARDWSASGAIGRLLRSSFHVALNVNGNLFVHAGLLPIHAGIPPEELRQQLWKHVDSNACGTPPADNGWDLLGDGGPLWTRILVELPEEYACTLLRKSLKKAGAVRMVVGHTPTLSKSIETRCDNRLVMIDTGLSRFLFDRPTLLEIHNGTYTQHHYERVGPDNVPTNSTSIVSSSKFLFYEESQEAHAEWLSQDERELDVVHEFNRAIIPLEPDHRKEPLASDKDESKIAPKDEHDVHEEL